MNTRRLLLILFSNNNERDDAQQRALSDGRPKYGLNELHAEYIVELPRNYLGFEFSLCLFYVLKDEITILISFVFFTRKTENNFYRRIRWRTNVLKLKTTVSRTLLVMDGRFLDLALYFESDAVRWERKPTVRLSWRRTGTNEKLRIK